MALCLNDSCQTFYYIIRFIDCQCATPVLPVNTNSHHTIVQRNAVRDEEVLS